MDGLSRPQLGAQRSALVEPTGARDDAPKASLGRTKRGSTRAETRYLLTGFFLIYSDEI